MARAHNAEGAALEKKGRLLEAEGRQLAAEHQKMGDEYGALLRDMEACKRSGCCEAEKTARQGEPDDRGEPVEAPGAREPLRPGQVREPV